MSGLLGIWLELGCELPHKPVSGDSIDYFVSRELAHGGLSRNADCDVSRPSRDEQPFQRSMLCNFEFQPTAERQETQH